MTDTYIWEKIKERFYSMNKKKRNEETGEIEIEWFPFFKKQTERKDEYGNKQYEDIEYPDFKDDSSVKLNVIEPNRTLNGRPVNDIWFEIFPLHDQPFQQEWGTHGRNRWTFGLQINMNRPKDFGTDDFDEAYDFIASNFKRGDIFDGIRVLKTAYRSSARLLDDYYSEPVTVMVQADLDN